MSAGTAPQALATADGVAMRRRRRGRPLAGTRLATARVPLAAFAVSRLIVYATGAIGVLTLHKHDGAAAAAIRHGLGPIGNALAGSVARFDAGYYLSIAAHGFGAPSAGRVAFFPLYPLLIRAATPLLGSDVLAGAVISAVAFAAALVVVHRLAELELGRRTADGTVWLLALAPLSFFFTALYSESLFLLLTAGTLLAARRERWRTACLLGSLATLTRPVGILLAIALLVLWVRSPRRVDRRIVAVLSLPATLLAYMGVVAALGYGWLAPFRAQQHWGRVFTGPIYAVLAAAWAAVRGIAALATGTPVFDPTRGGPLTASAQSVVLLVVLVIAGWALLLCWRRLPRAYAAYATVDVLVVLSSPAVGQPLWSVDRYVLTLFPLWIAAADWLVRRRLLVPVLALGSGLLVFYTLAFSSWAFVA